MFSVALDIFPKFGCAIAHMTTDLHEGNIVFASAAPLLQSFWLNAEQLPRGVLVYQFVI